MRWYKHYTDMHRGQSINKLMDDMGHTGLCFFILQEMCAEKLEKEFGDRATEADCSFSFHTRIVRQNLRISAANLRRLLDICQEVGQLSYDIRGNSVQINMPILLKLLERDTKSAVTQRRSDKKACPPDIDKEEDKEEDKDNTPKKLDLESVYNLYRLKKGKSKGLQKLQKEIKTEIDFENLKKAIKNYNTDLDINKTEFRFIMHFSTFVSEWRDWVDYQQPVGSHRGAFENSRADIVDDFNDEIRKSREAK